MSANLGWLFYRDYFDSIEDYGNIDAESVAQKVDDLIATSTDLIAPDDEYMGNHHFEATTTYPGLLLGIGNTHELPGVTGQAILGFHFDYTTGLPSIPGSSIKGALRSAFAHPGYITELLHKIKVVNPDEIDIGLLEREIFGQSVGEDDTRQGSDVFFDAVIISAHNRVLEDDYITPHGDNLTKEPIPLRFIKVSSGVAFRFDFGLTDKEMLLSPDKRIALYRNIIEDLGLGAKTNVGYGYFEKFEEVSSPRERCDAILRSDERTELEKFVEAYPDTECIDAVKGRIGLLEVKAERERLMHAWGRLKKNPSKVQDFYSSHKDNPAIADFLKEEMAKRSNPSTNSDHKADDDSLAKLASANTAKKFKKALPDKKFTSDDLVYIKEQAIRLFRSLENDREKSSFFKTIQLGAKIGNEFDNEVQEAVGFEG